MSTRDLEAARKAYNNRDAAGSKAAHSPREVSETLEEIDINKETHKVAGSYIKSVVFGGLDGIITTFAVVSGATGGGLGVNVILILGFSNIIADAISMGVGDALSTKAENEYILRERGREEWELENDKQGEIREMVEIFVGKGMSKEDATDIITKFANYPDLFVDFMMHEELELMVPGEDDNPWKDGLVTLVSFIVFGFVPLSAYAFLYRFGLIWAPCLSDRYPHSSSVSSLSTQALFAISCALTATTLFILGAIKTKVTYQPWWRGGLEILVMGSCTAGAAFFIGYLVELAVTSGDVVSLH